jgi:hypothetical protein
MLTYQLIDTVKTYEKDQCLSVYYNIYIINRNLLYLRLLRLFFVSMNFFWTFPNLFLKAILKLERLL